MFVSVICTYNEGRPKSSLADQDTLMEYEKMEFIFHHTPCDPYTFFCHCCSAWIPLVKTSSTADMTSPNFFSPASLISPDGLTCR